MKEVGGLFAIGGGALALYATLAFDPTVDTFGTDNVVNLQLLATQLCMVIIGGFSFVGGIVLYCAGAFLERRPAPDTSKAEHQNGPE